MSFEDKYLGCPTEVPRLRALNEELNSKVLQTINDTQELVMFNDLTKESSEYMIKKCLQDRISELTSWKWVLQDLSKRLEEACVALNYELKALKVVVQRVDKEIEEHCEAKSKPGALCPLTDAVEENIIEEYKCLRDQKSKFKTLIKTLEQQIESLKKTNTKILNDVTLKNQAIAVEESCAKISLSSISSVNLSGKKKVKCKPIKRWENRCLSLKAEGLRALCRAVVTRHQVRGARMQLTLVTEAHTAKVDAALKRRLHANCSKYAELEWQKEEAHSDLKALEEEKLNTEQSLLKNMELERLVQARMGDRRKQPPGELLKDEINAKLKEEFARIRNFVSDLRKNLGGIEALQNKLKQSIVKIDCTQVDLMNVITLDDQRIQARLGELPVVTHPKQLIDRKPSVQIVDKQSTQSIKLDNKVSAQNVVNKVSEQSVKSETFVIEEDGEYKTQDKEFDVEEIDYSEEVIVEFSPKDEIDEEACPPCTIADLPPEARPSLLSVIKEESEFELENNECGDAVNVKVDDDDVVVYDSDDDGLDDYPFDF